MAKNQLEHEIDWIRNEMATKKLSQKQRKEYEKQIKHKELTLALRGVEHEDCDCMTCRPWTT